MYRLLKAELGPDYWIPGFYRNADTGKFYKPHHPEEAEFVFSDEPRRYLVKGGEGSGKSVAGCIKDLERLRRGMNGIMVSPDLPHFKKSLWPEFKRWCPWQHVIEEQQYRGKASWEPNEGFTLTFKTGGQVVCGGIENPDGWEGPNVSWAHFDEARRHKVPQVLKVLDGRVRIKGMEEEPPQLWLTTTPKKHWLFQYFGPPPLDGAGDPLEEFKQESKTITLRTQDNEINTFEGYANQRGKSLTEAEKRVLLEADWEDVADTDRFLPSITWWDNCLDKELPSFDPRKALVLGVDGAKHNDCFAVVGVQRHPVRRNDIVVRYSRIWQPKPGHPVSLSDVEKELKELRTVHNWHIVQVAYDPYQLELMMEGLGNVMWTDPFNQQADREKADSLLLDLIKEGRIAHDGNHTQLRQHLANADRKLSGVFENKLRIVKREESLKVDAAVALSMAAYRALVELNL